MEVIIPNVVSNLFDSKIFNLVALGTPVDRCPNVRVHLVHVSSQVAHVVTEALQAIRTPEECLRDMHEHVPFHAILLSAVVVALVALFLIF